MGLSPLVLLLPPSACNLLTQASDEHALRAQDSVQMPPPLRRFSQHSQIEWSSPLLPYPTLGTSAFLPVSEVTEFFYLHICLPEGTISVTPVPT